MTIEEYNYDYTGTYNERRTAVSAFHYIYARDIASTGAGFVEGAVLGSTETGVVYRVVGGAPIRLYNQGAVPRFSGSVTTMVHQQVIDQIPAYPADGAYVNIVEAGGSGIYRSSAARRSGCSTGERFPGSTVGASSTSTSSRSRTWTTWHQCLPMVRTSTLWKPGQWDLPVRRRGATAAVRLGRGPRI
ncbi:hypothetical protein [Amycolatopsis sp. NPDC004378]